MVGQKKITSFFSGGQRLKSLKRAADESKDAGPVKKIALGSHNSENVKKKQSLFTSPNAKSVGLQSMGESWRRALEGEFRKDYFVKLSKFVASERASYTVYPPTDEVFTWTRCCALRDVKVVILGQDPYHGENQAHGLCFSVKPPVKPPPSLENMFKELRNDIEGFVPPGHGDLTGWAKQGVLLLNAVLTVRAHCANSHKDKGWEQFTDSVIKYISTHRKGVVFLLWGSYAQKKGKIINKSQHHVLSTVHPSPLSAYRGFFGCKHFSRANELLKAQGDGEINWCDL